VGFVARMSASDMRDHNLELSHVASLMRVTVDKKPARG
jgi:hypothetical protein